MRAPKTRGRSRPPGFVSKPRRLSAPRLDFQNVKSGLHVCKKLRACRSAAAPPASSRRWPPQTGMTLIVARHAIGWQPLIPFTPITSPVYPGGATASQTGSSNQPPTCARAPIRGWTPAHRCCFGAIFAAGVGPLHGHWARSGLRRQVLRDGTPARQLQPPAAVPRPVTDTTVAPEAAAARGSQWRTACSTLSDIHGTRALPDQGRAAPRAAFAGPTQPDRSQRPAPRAPHAPRPRAGAAGFSGS
jgi:hypothetical protein